MDENVNSTPVIDVDDWADIDFSDVADNAEPVDDDIAETENTENEPSATEEPVEADQPTAEEPAEPSGAEPNAEEQPVTDQYTLKHLDEVKTVGRDEVVALAQKGMDYDRIKAKLEAKEGREAEAFAFLENLAKEQNTTVDEFMDSTRASLLAKKEGIEYNAALQRVRLERREAAVAAKEKALSEQKAEQAKTDAIEAKRKQDIADFRAAYPDVDGKSIPKEVWTDVSKGLSLLNAYAKYENARIRAELEAEKKNTENKARAAGSKADTGKTKADPFDALWYNGD